MFIYICLYFLLFFVETDKHKWNRPELRGQQTEQPVTSLIRTLYEKLVNGRVSFHVAKATSWDLLKMNPVVFYERTFLPGCSQYARTILPAKRVLKEYLIAKSC